jgi:hypothetical protein
MRRRITIEWDDDEGDSDEECLLAFKNEDFTFSDLLDCQEQTPTDTNLVVTCETIQPITKS